MTLKEKSGQVHPSVKMRNEIGSEFWEVPTGAAESNPFFRSAQWFLSGRSALQAIIRENKGCHTVALPSWCCDSMIKPFADAGLKVRFYPVYWQNELIQETHLDSDILLLMDYFGYTTDQPALSGYTGVVIRDITHSIFSSTYSDADYYYGSLRKWCGVWTGGYAWTKDGHKMLIEMSSDHGFAKLREKAMLRKAEYISGERTDKDYLIIYEEAEETLESIGIVPGAERDVDLANSLDVEYIKTRRRANAEVLRSAFPDWLLFPEVKPSDCPMFVPVLVPNGKREALRHHLIRNEIYCPIHWPVSGYHELNERTGYIYQNELSLICDQRYSVKDMNRIIETIKTFWKGA